MGGWRGGDAVLSGQKFTGVSEKSAASISKYKPIC